MNTIPGRPRKEKYKRPADENDPFEKVTAFVPKSLSKLLRHISIQQDIPMSKLIAIAIDHEIERNNGFDQMLKKPESEFKKNEYVDESVRIFEFLKKFPGGTGVDTLWLFRREFGIKDKEIFMLSYRELIYSGMVEEFYPQNSKFKYPKTYRYVRILGITRPYGPRKTETGLTNDDLK